MSMEERILIVLIISMYVILNVYLGILSIRKEDERDATFNQSGRFVHV